MAKRNPFVKGLIERYREAFWDERRLEEEYQKASRALADTRETKRLCAALLIKEGEDPAVLENEFGIDPMVAKTVIASNEITRKQPHEGRNGTTPMNATHAVYIVMRGRNNAPATLDEIANESDGAGMKLSIGQVNKVVWTQVSKDRMEKLVDGRVRLTPKGESFTSFRKKVTGEEFVEMLTKSLTGQES